MLWGTHERNTQKKKQNKHTNKYVENNALQQQNKKAYQLINKGEKNNNKTKQNKINNLILKR